MDENTAKLQAYEEQQDREAALLDQFERECQEDVDMIRMARLSIDLRVNHYMNKYGVDFSDDAEDIKKDS